MAHVVAATLLLCSGFVAGFQVGTRGLSRATHQFAVQMSTGPDVSMDTMEECIVNAENAVEIAACSDTETDAVAPTSAAAAPPDDGVLAATERDLKMGYNAKTIEECLVEAENGEEVQECNTDYDDLVS